MLEHNKINSCNLFYILVQPPERGKNRKSLPPSVQATLSSIVPLALAFFVSIASDMKPTSTSTEPCLSWTASSITLKNWLIQKLARKRRKEKSQRLAKTKIVKNFITRSNVQSVPLRLRCLTTKKSIIFSMWLQVIHKLTENKSYHLLLGWFFTNICGNIYIHHTQYYYVLNGNTKEANATTCSSHLDHLGDLSGIIF